MRYNPISSSLFEKNRKKVLEKLPKNAIAIIHSNDQMPRNGDLYFPFRQNSDFFYLTGIEQEKSILILNTNESDQQKQAILFIIEPKLDLEIWEGKKLNEQEASDISGITTVYFENTFNYYITKLAQLSKYIYVNKNENPRFQSNIKSRDQRFTTIIKRGFPDKQFERLAPIISDCRLIKEPEEIALIQSACGITRDAFLSILPKIKPGIMEYEVEAMLTKYFIQQGANGHAYEPIIASGKNSCYLHYNKNNCSLQSGDILFMDFGAEYANYASDCSRAIPISGAFSKRQKEVYNAVLRVLKHTKKIMVAGTTIAQYHKQTCHFMQEELLNLGLISIQDIAKQTQKKPAYFTYFMHGVSHFMGLDTHDVGTKETILKPGMILTCEPGIYIPNENLGIRLENDILITEDGNIDLMADIPIEIEEIEAAMRK